jgi:hypothetical protein
MESVGTKIILKNPRKEELASLEVQSSRTHVFKTLYVGFAFSHFSIER